jgi:DNA-directed RNA polymerase subunit RPC12/RpoP
VKYKCRSCGHFVTNDLMPPAELRYLPSVAPPEHTAMLYRTHRHVPQRWLANKPRVIKLCPDCAHRAVELLVRT